jgi:hypothetical protein
VSSGLEEGEEEHAKSQACESIPDAPPARVPQRAQASHARRAETLLGKRAPRRCAKKCWRRTHEKENKAAT